jgi:hypothetical protein
VEEATYPEGCVVSTSEYGYALDPRINDSFTAVVKLQGLGYKVSRAECAVTCDEAYLPPGAFIVKDAKVADLEVLAKELNLTVYPLCEDIGDTVDVKPPKIGMYQRYYGGNMDEGWTRLMLEQFSIPYKTIMDDIVKKGDLKQSLDTIILPNDSETMIMGGDLAEYYKKRYGGRMSPPTYPPEYRSGIGDEGVEALKKFVNEGGTLVCFGGACEFAINKMDLKVTNVLKDVPSKEFFCPGSTLHANVDSNHPAAYGMPEDSLILFWNSLAFNIVPSGDNDKYEVVASFPERDIMESGWLIGEEKLKRKAAMVVAHVGEGKVVLIGFRPQNRAQTHGTYKLIFNSLFG